MGRSLRFGALVLALSASVASARALAAQTVPYDVVASRYFVKNTVPLRPRTFFLIRDLATFDRVFGYGAVAGPPKRIVTAADFASHALLVAIASGPLCKLRVTSVTSEDMVDDVAYSSACDRPGSARFAVPLLIFVPLANLREAVFIENGRRAGTVGV